MEFTPDREFSEAVAVAHVAPQCMTLVILGSGVFKDGRPRWLNDK